VYNDWATCSIIVNGHAILFGAGEEMRQISVVYRNGIRRINNLPFRFQDGRCHLNNGTVFLCFDSDHETLCRTRYLHYKNPNLSHFVQKKKLWKSVSGVMNCSLLSVFYILLCFQVWYKIFASIIVLLSSRRIINIFESKQGVSL